MVYTGRGMDVNMNRLIVLTSGFVVGLASAAAPTHGLAQGRGGRGDAPQLGPGNLVTGAWGADPVPLDPRGWGWMTKSYVTSFKRPFYNRAKEMLFSDKQV